VLIRVSYVSFRPSEKLIVLWAGSICSAHSQPEVLRRDAAAESPPDRTGASTERKAEAPVGTPRNLIFAKTDRLHRFCEGWNRDALTNPSVIHVPQRMCPDLKVVWTHEQVCNPRAESLNDPLFEVARDLTRRACGNQSFDGTPTVGGIKAVQIVLERIGNEAFFHPNPTFALVPDPSLSWEGEVHVLVELAVMRKLDVAAQIPGEAMRINMRGGETPRGVRRVDQEKIVASDF